MQAGDIIELELTDLSYLGGAVGHVGDGLAVFATGGLPGERARVEIAERKRQYARGRVVEVLAPAPERVAPPCPYFGACGGCQWQHLEYAAQVRWKSEQVRRQIRRIAHLGDPPVRPTIPAPNPWNYRNQGRFSLDARGRLGFTHFQSHHLLPIDACLIMQPEIVALMPRLQGALPGGHQIVVRHGAQTGQFLIAPRLDLPDLESGQSSYDERLLGRTYRVSAPSFFQVNTRVEPVARPVGEESPPLDQPRYPRAATWAAWSDATREVSQAELLALLVLDRLPLTGRELVVDAYCGVGTFALPIAARAGRVIGIEEAPAAVADARHNARGLDHVEFRVGRTEDRLGNLPERPDAVVLDPSRVGCAPDVLAALAELHPDTLVYVSCDPATLARDLARLVASGFELVDVQPIDMFPQTHHVETVSVLRGSSGG